MKTIIVDNSASAALKLPVEGYGTVRDYLVELLLALWIEGEGFSGKRPFGESAWEYDLYIPLMNAGLIGGKLDEHGYVQSCDRAAGDKIIRDAIELLRGAA